ncbi:hypothetical protein BGZ65_010234, partial [Modicella reniformis]
IAYQFPNALYYPLMISAENFTFEKTQPGEKRREDVAKLKGIIHSPLKEKFMFELRRLTNPEHLLTDWLEQTVTLFQSKIRDKKKIMALFEDLRALILDISNPRVGSITKAFVETFSHNLETLRRQTGQDLANMTKAEFNGKILKPIRGEILGKQYPKSDTDLLKSYSPWLHSFQASDHEEKIDIPGQYAGLDAKQTITIVRFNPRVLVMSSLRKPKKLCILGSDEREYQFLVKGGEDLRLDQRIQQLFALMNDIMRKDPQCSQQDISISTYKVIPMSSSLGIIEWVDNTQPLRICIEGELSNRDVWKRIQKQHKDFVWSFKGEVMGYHNLYIQASRDKVIGHMESLHTQLREDLLRESVLRSAASPEAFFMLRAKLIRSLAAVNVCSYVLGIGDRHLDNLLLDMSKGQLIPIDFGHSFGSATETLA